MLNKHCVQFIVKKMIFPLWKNKRSSSSKNEVLKEILNEDDGRQSGKKNYGFRGIFDRNGKKGVHFSR